MRLRCLALTLSNAFGLQLAAHTVTLSFTSCPADSLLSELSALSVCLVSHSDAFRSKKDTAEQRHLPTITQTEQTVDRDGDQDPVGPSGLRNIPPANPEHRYSDGRRTTTTIWQNIVR